MNYINELLFRLLDNNINDREFSVLVDWLNSGEEAKLYYCQFMEDCGAMSIRTLVDAQGQDETFKGDLLFSFDSELWKQLAQHEKTAPEIEMPEEEKPPRELLQKVIYPPKEKRRASKLQVFTLMMSAAAMILFLLFIKFAPPKTGVEVATLIDSIGAKWADMDAPMQNGTRLFTGKQTYMLREGLVKLEFDTQAKAVIEAPAEFVLITDDQVKLSYGRLYASVPNQAIGFTVTTPNAKIIDLGTEFGVQVDFGQTTELHVIKGKTTIVAGQGDKQSLQVSEGSAKKITSRSAEIQSIRCDTDLFVRNIRSEHNMVWRGDPLGLADLIKSSDRGILKLGSSAIQNMVIETPEMAPGEVWPVESNPFVDSLFVPNGINGPISVTQDGQFIWHAPTMEARQKIGYLRFDIDSVKGDRTGATLALSIRNWAGKKGDIHVYGLKDGRADFWDETQMTYNSAVGCLPTVLGRYELDRDVLDSLGVITLSGGRLEQSKISTLQFDEFIAQDTNGLLTLILVREQNDLSAEWIIRTKESLDNVAPKLRFPYAANGAKAISTAVGRGADTYLSNDNQYDSTGPDNSHGTEPVFKIRNYFKNKSSVMNAGLIGLQDELFSGMRRLMLHDRLCGTNDYPAICMRTNTGITFDLQEIRHYFDDTHSFLRSFTAVCGPADVSAEYCHQQRWDAVPQAGFYVLVDGQERFVKIDMKPGEVACPIEVELEPKDRYLTLVVTGGSNRKAPADWSLFACPQINVE